LASALDLSPSTLSRLAKGYTPDTAPFTSKVTWLNIPAERFIRADAKPVRDQEDREQPDFVATLELLLRARKDLKPADIELLEQLIWSAVRRFDNERATQDQ